VFHPVPKVDSVLVRMRRRTSPGAGGEDAGPPQAAVRALVAGAFAHRRKTLAGSLGLTGAAPGRSREQVRAALAAIGRREDARAEQLSPDDFRALAGALRL
jgi:16S rRNA (adenine1518-N6/adenine1519-N6)-dimethyltransferase